MGVLIFFILFGIIHQSNLTNEYYKIQEKYFVDKYYDYEYRENYTDWEGFTYIDTFNREEPINRHLSNGWTEFNEIFVYQGRLMFVKDGFKKASVSKEVGHSYNFEIRAKAQIRTDNTCLMFHYNCPSPKSNVCNSIWFCSPGGWGEIEAWQKDNEYERVWDNLEIGEWYNLAFNYHKPLLSIKYWKANEPEPLMWYVFDIPTATTGKHLKLSINSIREQRSYIFIDWIKRKEMI